MTMEGGDDRRLLIWNLWKTIFDSKAPFCINTTHNSNINTIAFNVNNKTVATGGNFIQLETSFLIVSDIIFI